MVFGQHHLLAGPQQGWERLKVGGGTPPVRTSAGWLVLYHGVSGQIVAGVDQQQGVCYSAGLLLLELCDPRRVLYRSARSILEPRTRAERQGTVPRVVFPTGVDAREDGALDVYYGMADSRIGVARHADRPTEYRYGASGISAPPPEHFCASSHTTTRNSKEETTAVVSGTRFCPNRDTVGRLSIMR
jgi:predicted GH43/DUF377 family glycosyl hydrolase